jgi:hypothetical protein
VDSAGNAYLTGQTFSTAFPVTPGAFQTTNHAAANQSSNAFITKLNPTGTALVYSTYLGGSGNTVYTTFPGDVGNAIAVDTAGNVYVAGETFSPDFPVTPGAFQTATHAATGSLSNAFVTELNPAGTALVYSTYLGGSGQLKLAIGDIGYAIAVGADGEAYVAGFAGSADFPVTAGAFQTTGSGNAFITKLNPTGAALVYSTYLGGSGGDTGRALAADSAGNVYVAGGTGSRDFPVTAGAFQTTNHVAAGTIAPNAFIAKLNPAGAALVYSTYLGGSGGVVWETPSLSHSAGDQASGLAIDSVGNAYVTGSTASANFPVTQDAYQTINQDQPGCVGGCIGGYNAFISELNSAGSALVYSTYLGGTGYNPLVLSGVLVYGEGDQASALALDNSGDVYIAGSANSYDFPVTAGALQMTVNSRGGNAFVAKLNMAATSTAVTPTVTVTPASSDITSTQSLTVAVSVSGGSGSPEPTGTVWLASGGTYSSGPTTLSGGSATIDIPAGALIAEPPTYPIPDELIAKYVPDAASSAVYNFSSGSASVTVTQATPGFTIWGTPVTVKAGATTGNTSAVEVVPAGGGFTGSVALTAAVTSSPSGAQDLPTLSFGSTSPVSIGGTFGGTATLTVSTTAPGVCSRLYQTPGGIFWYMWGGAALVCVLLLGMQARRRRCRLALAMVALLATLVGGLASCGGGPSSTCTPTPGTTPGLYTVTVTGTSGSTTATGSVGLTVQ